MAPPIRKTKFVPEWIDMTPKIPVPKVDWIKDKKLDVPYGDAALQKIDIYYPNGITKDTYPVLILVHGGGFARCDKRDWHVYPGFHALAEGFVLVSVNYRLAPAVSFPAETDDLKTAVSYLRRHAHALRLDADNFFLYGTSAGGNLVSFVGLEGNASRNTSFDFHVNAVAALCPLINFNDCLQQIPFYLKLLPPVRKALHSYLGGNPVRMPHLASQASADHHITPNPPAFYIQHGDHDPAVPIQQSLDFYKKLKESGYFKEGDLVLDILPGAPHAGAGPEYLEPKNVMPIIEFFKAHKTTL
ncbi:alpha/beta hydrolase [Lachnospiraceae bacterium OttesenSCG-928-D06]|nr:alpha/beta hydrolase [Lachnospiraceae bacterium OttesenSCG-928-D06]